MSRNSRSRVARLPVFGKLLAATSMQLVPVPTWLVALALNIVGCAGGIPRPDDPIDGQKLSNPELREDFASDLRAAQSVEDPVERQRAVCRVAHDWGIEDCSNVTEESLVLP
jgi:hypothetical protein